MNLAKTAYLHADTKNSDPVAYEDYKSAAKLIVEKFVGA